MRKIKQLNKPSTAVDYLLGYVSLFTAAWGVLSSIVVVMVAINQRATFDTLILFSVMALLLLPIAYITGKAGRSPLR